MRKLAAMLLAALLLQGTYGPVSQMPDTVRGSVTIEETGAALAQTILNSQSDGESYTALFAEDVEFYLTQVYDVSLDDPTGGAAIYVVGGVNAREIAVIWGKDVGQRDNAEALDTYRQNRYADFFGYAPDQAELVKIGQVLSGENWLVLLLCAEPEKAREALARDYPGLALERYDQKETSYDWRQYYDERGYRRFISPNLVDMTLYDTGPILAAYATGNSRGLSEKDAAILQKCRGILSACVTDGMTDFEKELALHDWLVDNCGYDLTARYSLSATGRADNKNPYGLLVEGYGVCLGYATSFQLLMDLAGVECITVVGASVNSSRDHAWNMVKLEGEWYCVDLTWDDPVFSVDPAFYLPSWLAERHHRYFNVTSDDMRETGHQWDYDSVPEAAATRFRWDGVGQKPV